MTYLYSKQNQGWLTICFFSYYHNFIDRIYSFSAPTHFYLLLGQNIKHPFRASFWCLRATLEVCHCAFVSYDVSRLDFWPQPDKSREYILQSLQNYSYLFSCLEIKTPAAATDALISSAPVWLAACNFPCLIIAAAFLPLHR